MLFKLTDITVQLLGATPFKLTDITVQLLGATPFILTDITVQQSCRNLFPVCQTIGLADVDMWFKWYCT
jgi:hypothetical protein